VVARLPRPRRTTLAAAGVVLLLVGAVAQDSQAIQAVLLGTGSGALIAALALGVVVTFRGSGVVNVATGAMAMYASYVFASLNGSGNLLLVGWQVHLGDPWPLGTALAATVALSALVGGAAYLLVFAPMRSASPVAKVVASVGVLLTLQSTIVLQYGSDAFAVRGRLGNGSVQLPHDIVVPTGQLILAGLVVAIAVGLWALYRFTPVGLATRAAAEDERHLTLLGHSPFVVSGGNWIFSGMVVALLASLTATVTTTVDPETVTLLVVPALAAALLGRFTSFGLATVGGIGIGMLQALIQYCETKPWYPTANGSSFPGVGAAVPLLIILVTLTLRRGGIPGRGTLGEVRLPHAPAPGRLAPRLAIGVVVGLVGFLVLSPTWRLAEINTLVGIVVCLSLVILTGFVGQVSLAQMALAGLSAFVLAKLSAAAGLGFPFAPLLGALAASGVSVLVAIPAARARGVQLAMVTLAAAVAIQALVFSNPWFAGGIIGSAHVPSPSLLGLRFGPTDRTSIGDGNIPFFWFGVFCLALAVVLAALTSLLRGSPWGRRMLAVRANERAAAAMGISVSATKVVAFGVSGLVAGLAGAMSAYRFGSANPEYFGAFASLTFLAFAYMGGISSVAGAVMAGLLITNGVLAQVNREIGISATYYGLLGGLGLTATIVTHPDGLAGRLTESREALARRLARRWRRPAAAPSEEPSA
jgi:branched-chain amino acid transport system permease protein